MNDQQQRAFRALDPTEGFATDTVNWTREDWFVAGWNAAREQAGARPVAWIEKAQLEQLQDVTADAWVYWRETDHVAEDDEIALFTHPAGAAARGLNEREIADTVNKVRDIAKEFHATQQLRECIARVLVPLLTRASAAAVGEASSDARDAARYRWLRDPKNVDAGHYLAANTGAELDNVIDGALGLKTEAAPQQTEPSKIESVRYAALEQAAAEASAHIESECLKIGLPATSQAAQQKAEPRKCDSIGDCEVNGCNGSCMQWQAEMGLPKPSWADTIFRN